MTTKHHITETSFHPQKAPSAQKKTPLVMIHGYLGGKDIWQPILADLQEKRPIITPDLPGFGAAWNEHSPTTIRDFALTLLDYIDTYNLPKFDLLGHSMGGMIVQEMMHIAPEKIRKFICYGTGPLGSLPERFETLAQSRDRFSQNGVIATAEMIAATWFREGRNAEYYPLCQKLGAKVSLENAHAGLYAMEGWDGRDYLSAIQQPTLVIAGDDDRSYGEKYINMLADTIPNTEKVILKDCCHNAHLEQPKLFLKTIENYLERL